MYIFGPDSYSYHVVCYPMACNGAADDLPKLRQVCAEDLRRISLPSVGTTQLLGI